MPACDPIKKKSPEPFDYLPHKNMKVLLNETRMPMRNVKSKAFPSFKEHIEKIKNWRPSFEVKESKFNEVRHKS